MKPFVSVELLTYLRENFPDRCARPGMPESAIWTEAGSRLVVAHLERLHDEQVGNALNGS